MNFTDAEASLVMLVQEAWFKSALCLFLEQLDAQQLDAIVITAAKVCALPA